LSFPPYRMSVVKNKLGINDSTDTIFRKWTNHSGLIEKRN
jgi:hypothetical protein